MGSQQELKSNDHSLNGAIDVAVNVEFLQLFNEFSLHISE